MEKEKEELLTTEQLAERWGIHKATLNNWRSKKKGPKYIKLGKHVRSPILYRLSDIIEYENQSVIKTGA